MKLCIKDYRKKRRITLEELSERTGRSKAFLSMLENNQRMCTANTLEKIAFSLNVCPKKLIKGCYFRKYCSICPRK